MKLVIDTYEDNSRTPVLTHTFYGATAQDIQGVVEAHKQTDSFFKAAMTTGKFRGMRLTNISRWVK